MIIQCDSIRFCLMWWTTWNGWCWMCLLEYSYTSCAKCMIECIKIWRSVTLQYRASESNWTETMNGSLRWNEHSVLCSRLHIVQQLSNSHCPGNSLYMNNIFQRKQFLNWSINCCTPLLNKYFNPSTSPFNKNKGWTRNRIALYCTPKVHNLYFPDVLMLP